MEIINNILFVEAKSLIKASIVKKDTLIKGCKRQRSGNVTCWAYERFSFINGEFIKHDKVSRKGLVYLYFDTLRDEYKEAIQQQLCYGFDPYLFALNKAEITINQKIIEGRKLLKKQRAEKQDIIASDYKNNLTDKINVEQQWLSLLIEKGCKRTDAERKARTCAWLQLLVSSKPKQIKSYGYTSKPEFKNEVYNLMTSEFKQGLIMFKNSKMPANMRVLDRYVQAFKNNGALSMLSGKRDNQNRTIIGKSSKDSLMVGGYNIKEWHASTLIFIYTNPGAANKFDLRETYRRYESKCKKDGYIAASRRAVETFLTSDAIKIHCMPERDGWKKTDDFMPRVHGKKVEKSLNKGGFDGFSVDFYSEIDSSNIMLTTVALFDYASGAITGYSVGMVENGLMVRQAMRNHLHNTNNLGYYELESDRFSGNLSNSSKRLIKGMCNEFKTPAPNLPINESGKKKPANPKSRYVERLIQEVNRKSQNISSYKGGNITSVRSNMRPNPDYKVQGLKGYNAGVDAIIMLINAYNHEKLDNGKSRWQMFTENISKKAPKILGITKERMFCEYTTSTVRQAAITIEHKETEYSYDFAHYLDVVHKLNKGLKCRVVYDPDDMSSVKIYKYNDKKDITQDSYVCSLDRISEVQRAIAERTTEDVKELGTQHSKRNKTIHNMYSKFMQGIASTLEIDISGMAPDDMNKIVRGAIAKQGSDIVEPFVERYKEALTSKEAKQHEEYYRENLIPGKVVDFISHLADQEEDKKRAFIRNKFNKRNRGAS